MTQNTVRGIGRLWPVLVVFLILGLAACAALAWWGVRQYQQRGQTYPIQSDPSSGQQGGVSKMESPTPGISVQLSDSSAQPQTAVPSVQATGEPLTSEEASQILSRLPTLIADPALQVDFKLPQDPIPPPKPGQKIEQPFPPDAQATPPAQAQAGPLKVLRYAPEGEVSIAPFLNVTFDQPMVPLATLDDLKEEQVPVKISPSLPGTWRWLGTRTLNFQYDSKLIDRLPKATLYKITVPAGTKSATGGVLKEAVEWTFSTPPVKVVSTYPNNQAQPRDPLFFISFDQRIDQTTLLKLIQVSADGSPVAFEAVGEAAIKDNPKTSWLLKNVLEGRWVAFKAKELLPANTGISVEIPAGTPSAEGPLLTKEAQRYSFRTYAPLSIESYGCSWGNEKCPPLTPFNVQFNNPLDTSTFSENLLRISPELPGAKLDVYGSSLSIQGPTKGRTNYTVYISADLQDVYGQKLGKEARLTFKVGSADPVLVGPEDKFITLDPAAAKPTLSMYTINYSSLAVKIYAVQPSDWPAYKIYLRDYGRTDVKVQIPGRLVYNKTVSVESAADTLTEAPIDLSPVSNGKPGHFIVIVEPSLNILQRLQNQYYRPVQVWVQLSQIGLDALTDHSEMVAWTTALKDGAPLANVKVKAGPEGQEATTDNRGVARFPIPSGATYLVASLGDDQALLPRSAYYWGNDAWGTSTIYDELRWFVFDDRAMYRPGEEVHVKGWLRRVGGKQNGDVDLVGDGVKSLHYRILESQGNELGSGTAQVNALGGFDFAFSVPEKTNLGNAQLILDADSTLSGVVGQQFVHGFQILEFRRPEFEVTARNETSGPYMAGGFGVAAVEAKYYAGGPLPNADVTWQVSYTPSSYSPPNWSEFTFGTWRPWWYGDSYDGRPNDGGQHKTFTGKTDATGTHYLRLDFDMNNTSPVSILAEGTVMDVNRQAWSGTTSMLVHPAALYVGLRSERYFVERGTPLKVDFIVTDLDGKPVVDRPVEVKAARLEWNYKNGTWHEEEAEVQTCKEGSTEKPVTCTFETTTGGAYRIRAVVSDTQGRKNQSEMTRWVSGGKQPTSRKVEQESVNLIPDKETYQPGDVAQILVQPPFTPAEGLLTITRSGIVSTERFTIQEGTYTLKIPVEEKYIPNLNIQVDLTGSALRTNDQGETLKDVPPRPAYASGQLTLHIPPLQRTLSLQVTPAQKELEPGGETTLAVVLKDANGKPVSGGELAVVVVDEAVLALSNYQMADPIKTFYSERPSYLTGIYGRSSIILVDPLALARAAQNEQMLKDESAKVGAMPAAAPQATRSAEAPMAEMADGKGEGAAQAPIRVRSNFNPLATFAPAVRTDENGTAQVTIKMPDNLTRYRVMVVAVNQGRQFGSGEANMVARLPLMVRPSAPRFLNFGDRFEMPVVLQNQTDQDLKVEVVARSSNLELTGAPGLRVTVPARNRIEVRFPATTQKAGTARFQVAAVSGQMADSAVVELPVYTPATTEAFATYGVIDQGSTAQPVAAPSSVFSQYGGLEISTSSTALQTLSDAVLYLVAYPYECSEQLSSRILAVAALHDVLTAFKAPGLPSPEEMRSAVARDITRLQSMQNSDGGFPYWRRGQESVPYNTIHVAHALARVNAKDFSVPEDMQQRSLVYLREIENHYPDYYSQHTRQTLSAYALYVRNLQGDKDPQKALKLIKEAGLENLDLDAIGWLWPVLQDEPSAAAQLEELRRYVNNHAVETAGAANFTTRYDEQTYLLLSSERRTDAILLDAMILDNPKQDLIPKLVNGLLAHRTKGRWMNTQENVFVLLALDRYFNTFEAQTPDFVARIWLGDTYVGEQTFKGRTTDQVETKVPMPYLVDPSLGGGKTQDLLISKDGAGRLYYRLGLRYAPTNLKLEALDMGFVVQRVYEGVDDPKDVSLDKDGVWHIKAGAKVRVRLTMTADNRRYHVALSDPLPAGLEIVNPALAVSGNVPQDPKSSGFRYGWWWWGPWFEHQNLRDERAEAFTSLLWDGVYQYSYIARATTPGTFVVPPAKAEEMYSPEVFGRSASNVVIVE
jgi:uncharacterized protein YfaS (alpha-2-macroglobulin family)